MSTTVTRGYSLITTCTRTSVKYSRGLYGGKCDVEQSNRSNLRQPPASNRHLTAVIGRTKTKRSTGTSRDYEYEYCTLPLHGRAGSQ
eukprot:scaffold422219_cov19-Prasinocladus_malaysianus.AAC.1